MTIHLCPTCAAVQVPREHCCPTAALAEIDDLRRERDALTDRVRSLENENMILDVLYDDAKRALEENGVYL